MLATFQTINTFAGKSLLTFVYLAPFKYALWKARIQVLLKIKQNYHDCKWHDVGWKKTKQKNPIRGKIGLFLIVYASQ